MTSINLFLVILVLCPFVIRSEKSNETHFVATSEWQEIRPGQRVPSGLHYRINLETGEKEAKILEDQDNTSVVKVKNNEDDENQQQDPETNVELENARIRLENALKNIPADKFDGVSEERWKEIVKKHKTYEELKQDLKDLELEMKTEADLLKELLVRFMKIRDTDESSIAEKLTILEDLEYLSHSIDNALLFIELDGLDKVVKPALNQSSEFTTGGSKIRDARISIKSLKLLSVLLQNNPKAKKHILEKTNIGDYLIKILSNSVNGNQLSAALGSLGNLMRNNREVSQEYSKKGMRLLIDIIGSTEKSEITLQIKTKALVLLDDLIGNEESEDQDYVKILDNLKFCEVLEQYFNENKNGLIADVDSAEKALTSLVHLKSRCSTDWSMSPSFRHTLLVLLSNSRSQLQSIEEEMRFLYLENIKHLEELNEFLYSNLKIPTDDLSQKYEKYKYNEEL